MLSHIRGRAWHEWKVKQLALRAYAQRENLRRYNRQRGFIINPYAYGTAGGGPTDPDFSSVVSLLHLDGSNGSTTFTDVIGKTWTRTRSGTTTAISTTQSKFGGASLGISSTGPGGLETADHADWDFGSGNFTIEGWGYSSSLTNAHGNQGFFCVKYNGLTGGAPFLMQTLTDGAVQFLGSTDAVAWTIDCSSSAGLVSAGGWYFYRFKRTGNVFSGEVDGTQFASDTQAGLLMTNANVVVLGGYQGNDVLVWPGYIDDFRATKGVARTTGVPTAAFPDS